MNALRWEQTRVTDDHGTRAQPARIETVWVAHDDDGGEWMVAPHDDGTWNWTRAADDGEMLELGTDFASPELARQAAESRAAELLSR